MVKVAGKLHLPQFPQWQGLPAAASDAELLAIRKTLRVFVEGEHSKHRTLRISEWKKMLVADWSGTRSHTYAWVKRHR